MREAPLDPHPKYSWLQVVFDALIEYHPERIRDKSTAAERAVSERLLQRPSDPEELVALREALLTLEIAFPETKLKTEPAVYY
jgi:hypothetical protein